MITEETINRIREGYFDDLMQAIEFLIDTYNSKPFDMGYKSCLDDLGVYAKRLAESLTTEAELRNKVARHNGEKYYLLDQEETEEIIKEFFNKIKEDYGR